MKKLLLILLSVSFLVGCGSGGSQTPEVVQQPLTPPTRKQQIEHDLGLIPGYTATEAADIAREFVYVKVPYNWNQPDTFFFEADMYDDLVNGRLSFQCGQQATILMYLMGELGIPSHFVFLQGTRDDGSVFQHSTLEVFTDGEWWVDDPTYDVYWACDGEGRTDAIELRECEAPKPTTAGFRPNPTIFDTDYIAYYRGVSYVYPPIYD